MTSTHSFKMILPEIGMQHDTNNNVLHLGKGASKVEYKLKFEFTSMNLPENDMLPATSFGRVNNHASHAIMQVKMHHFLDILHLRSIISGSLSYLHGFTQKCYVT